MKEVVIFNDGKTSRGSRVKLIKRGNKRVLIEFIKYDYELGVDVLVREWFTLFVPWYVSNKKPCKHNNKRKFASYVHWETNEFYSDYYQSEAYKVSAKEAFTESYYNKLFSEGV